MNTADYLLNSENDDAIAFVIKDARVTYGAFKKMCAHLVAEMRKNGIDQGDRVAIWGVNTVYWAAAYLAILKIGAIAVPISTFISMSNFSQYMKFANCKYLFVDRSLANKVPNRGNQLPHFILDSRLLIEKPIDWPSSEQEFDKDHDAAIMFTSGTTALPRAVRITHRNIQANTDSIVQYLELNPKDRVMVILPFFYCFGTSLLHSHLRAGASLVLCNTFAYPETVIEMLEENECTGIAGVPSTYQTLLRNSSFPRKKLPALRKIQQAGGKLHDSLLRELINSRPNAKVYVMYGQTEATARLSYLPPELLESKFGSIGKGIPGVSLSVIGENGNPVREGEIGEIVATGENISPGYLDDEKATQEKFIQGCLFTGDLATVDEDGFIYIVDRKNDFIKSFGHRVSSFEIEACLLQIPDVIAAAAVGIPDLTAGELIKAFVILCDGSKIKEEELLTHSRHHLPKYMWPHEVMITKFFPTNAHGKVNKSELRKYGLK